MKALFKVLSVAFVLLGFVALLGGAVTPGLVLCGLGLAGIVNRCLQPVTVPIRDRHRISGSLRQHPYWR